MYLVVRGSLFVVVFDNLAFPVEYEFNSASSAEKFMADCDLINQYLCIAKRHKSVTERACRSEGATFVKCSG